MEVDILVGETMADLLDKTKTQLDSNLRELQVAAVMASSYSTTAESGNPRLLSVTSRLKDSSSKMVKKKKYIEIEKTTTTTKLLERLWSLTPTQAYFTLSI